MEKWYENKEMLRISAECDNAHDKKKKDKLQELCALCFERGHDMNRSEIERSKYLYDCFTCLSDWIELDMASIDRENFTSLMNRYEAEHEKCLYLCRVALQLAEDSGLLRSKDEIEVAFFKGYYYSVIVNYSNLLSQTGCLVSAIYVLNTINEDRFPMALGNLGLKLIEYGNFEYDKGHMPYIFRSAHQCLSMALDKPSDTVHHEARVAYKKGKKTIEMFLNPEFLFESLDFPFEVNNDMSRDEIDYREWCAKNTLLLNSLNDISYSFKIAYDPIHLPSIVCSIQDGLIPKYHGLFNQIKQEYVSARFLAYEGIVFRAPHFSDSDVYLVNTLDYPVYGLGIEKMKAAYRSVYALFDRVAYFLNEYFGLGIKENDVSYKSIWRQNSLLHRYVDNNYPLLGLKWVCKDISNKAVSEYKQHIDPVMAQVSDIRNAMEHRYFKILDYVPDSPDKDHVDGLAYLISFDTFERTTIELLRYAREAIMLLIMTVSVEERSRSKKRETDVIVGPLPLDKYEDEWKQIF